MRKEYTPSDYSDHLKEIGELASFLDNKEMYQLPGDLQLTQKDFERYQTSNQELVKRIPEALRLAIHHHNLSLDQTTLEGILSVSEADQERLRS